MAQIAFRLMHQKPQHQVASPLDTYHLLTQYLRLQFGHQLLHVVQALGQWATKKDYVAFRIELTGAMRVREGVGKSTKKIHMGFKLRLNHPFRSLRKHKEQEFGAVQSNRGRTWFIVY